ncbi:hypothetical protein BJ742DRAFT_777925 [Cladochytrium replicatum]|nr:hypothetical protein BJ742DRAFT_777925 [Cladochytrium replicatum]
MAEKTTLWIEGKEKQSVSASNNSKMPRVSLMAFVGTFLLAVLIIATVPTAVIVFTTSLSSVDTLAETIITDVVDRANSELSHILNGISASTLLFASSKPARAFLTSHARGYGRNVDYNYLGLQLLNSTPGLVYIVCAQATNLSGEVPSTWNQTYQNSTMYGVESKHAYYFDYTHPNSVVQLPIDSATGEVIGSLIDKEIPAEIVIENASIFWMLKKKLYGPYWLAEIVDAPRLTFAGVSRPMNVTNIFGETQTTVPFGCAATMLISEAEALLNSLTPTPNTRLYMTNAAMLLIATNKNISTVAEDGYTFQFMSTVPIPQAADKYISEMGSIFYAPSQEIQSYTSHDGTQWKLATRALILKHGESDFTLSVAIPRKDFFERVESSIQRGIVITIVASVLGLFLALVVVVLIITPIRRMVQNMAKATKFEFSSLEESLKLTRPSIFIELRILQETFAKMVKTFAEAIQRNKVLTETRR